MENKQYYAQKIVTRESIEMSNDMVLPQTERELLSGLYMEADMPRDFRIQFRHEPLEAMNAIKIVARLTIIDPTNPRIESDNDWFKWLKQAPLREGEGSSIHDTIESIYAPLVKAQIERAMQFDARTRATFNALDAGSTVIFPKSEKKVIKGE